MLAGIRDILVISAPQDRQLLRRLLGTLSDIGLPFDCATQKIPRGLADDFIVGHEFVGSDPVARILGDNIFYGNGLPSAHSTVASRKKGACVFGYAVNEPHAYWRDRARCSGRALSIEEKPKQPNSKLGRVLLGSTPERKPRWWKRALLYRSWSSAKACASLVRMRSRTFHCNNLRRLPRCRPRAVTANI